MAEHKAAYEAGERPVPSTAKRIMITGCPTGGVIKKIGEVIEKSGGVIVCNDSCNGERTSRMMIDPEAPDILRVLSDRYLKINCAVMTPNEGRLDSVRDLCEKYRVAGVIDNVLTGCHPFNVEGSLVERLCDGMGMPYMKLETDYSDGDSGQLSTRIAAFIEML